MTTNKSPAPRANAASRADFKAQAGDARPCPATKPRDGLRAGGPIDFEAINKASLTAFLAILARLLPKGKRVGTELVALNPRRADRRLGSFKINIRNGKWADFATHDKGGDPISLVAYLENVSQGEAARLLARMLGIEAGGPRRG